MIAGGKFLHREESVKVSFVFANFADALWPSLLNSPRADGWVSG
jgi:hypothetical protein